jgi:hypothetical protein
MLSGCEFLNSTLALMNYRVVAAIFPELAAAAEWFELPKTEDGTTEKAARMVLTAGTTALCLDLVEDPRILVAISLGEIGSALWRQCSSWFSLVGF